MAFITWMDDMETLSPMMFEQMMLQISRDIAWPSSLHQGPQLVKSAVLALGEDLLGFTCEAAAVATVCVELNYEATYQALCNRGFSCSLGGDVPSCYNARLNMMLPRALVKLGLCTVDRASQLQYVKSVLAIGDDEAQVILDNTMVPLMVTGKASVVTVAARVSAAIRLSYALHSHCVGEDHFQSDLTQWLQTCVVEVYQLHNARPVIVELVQALQIHKWRIRELFFELIGADRGFGEKLTMAEFDRMWVVTKFCSQIASSELLQKEAEMKLIEQESQELEDELNDTANTAELAALSARHQQQMDEHGILEGEVEQELEARQSVADDRLYALQVLSLSNVFLVALFGNPSWNRQVLDSILVVSVGGFVTEFALQFWYSSALWSPDLPELQVSCVMSFVVTSASAAGAVLLILNQGGDLIPMQDARTLSSLTGLLFITWNKHFSSMFLALGRAASTCVPVIVAIFMFVAIYAFATKDIYGDKVVDQLTGVAYFDTFPRSLSTLFMMFSGNLCRVVCRCFH